jgi:hypothetical protein
MNKPHLSTILSLSAAIVALIYLVGCYSPPAHIGRDNTLINECIAEDWITDTCVESAYYEDYNS